MLRDLLHDWFFNLNVYFRLLISHEIINSQEAPRIYRIYSINKKEKSTQLPNSLEDKSQQHNQAHERKEAITKEIKREIERESETETERVTKYSEK